ncbi:MAG: 50S ribosomal protein L10 [Alistipes sp.]|jgi:large subunit ribosomal protein L10|nr:50S ribosomal protein L10 [Alistipes sp.]
MTREEKNILIESLAEKLNVYSGFYLTDISTLDAAGTAELRRKCFERKISLVVIKNTLFIKALEKAGLADDELKGALVGSSAVMFTNVSKSPAVLIKEFRKTSDRPVLKAAYVEESVYIGENQLEMLINVKSRNELIADVIALLQSPAKNVISALQCSAGQKIAGLVKTLEDRGN